MNSDKRIPRLLGVAFFTVAVTSVLASLLSAMSLLSGSIADSLVNVANNLLQFRTSILLELITSLGIVVLAVLLFVVLQRQNKTMALVALGWWLVEAALLAASKVGAFALIPLSLDYVAAGTADAAYLQTLGALFFGVDR